MIDTDRFTAGIPAEPSLCIMAALHQVGKAMKHDETYVTYDENIDERHNMLGHAQLRSVQHVRLGRPGNACESQTARKALSLECQATI